MIKFINKVDGSVFYAEPNTIQFTVLKKDSNYEIEEEPIVEDEKVEDEVLYNQKGDIITGDEEVPTTEAEAVEIKEEKPTKKKAAK